MSRINSGPPDYELAERTIVTSPAELRAMAGPLRGTILELLLERAATVTELADALGRPKSTVAHHVKVLLDVGMLRVVRTRRVRAIEERFYGRTARLFYVGRVAPEHRTPPPWTNDLADAAEESMPAYHADTMWSIRRHARIPRDRAREFWQRIDAVVRDFTQIPRDGDTVFGLVVSLYPTGHPTLPAPVPDDPATGAGQPDAAPASADPGERPAHEADPGTAGLP